MPCSLNEIERLLRDETSGLAEKITRNLGDFTVALIAIYNGPNERLALAGTGTLLAIGGSHFILTARHVWDEVLSTADHVGVTLKPEITHRYSIARPQLTFFGLPKPAAWNEWGPDLALLRIPAESVGAIGAYRSFWNVDHTVQINGTAIELHVLMGTPVLWARSKTPMRSYRLRGCF